MLPWFTKYPNQNDEILNLDWVIRQVENLKAAYEAFLAANSLTFADPIIWDITKQYSKNTIVLSPEGDAYLSKKVVGAGIQLNNSDYWLEIFNFAEYVRTANSNLTLHIEQNTTRATDSYAVNDWLLWEDVLYKVTAAIAADDLLTVGTNIVHFTVEDFCRTWQTYMINTIDQYKRDIDASELAYKNEIDASELAYKNQLDASVVATTSSLQAQLDAAISGATVDSEVLNGRVTFNGNTYDTLGNAIRAQLTDVNAALEYQQTNLLTGVSFNNGLINPANGEVATSGSRSYCGTFIPIDTSKPLYMSCDVGYKYKLSSYSSNDTSGYIETSADWLTGTIKINSPAAYYRITYSTTGDAQPVATTNPTVLHFTQNSYGLVNEVQLNSDVLETIWDILPRVNLLQNVAFTDGLINPTDGSESTSGTRSHCTEYVPVDASKPLYFSCDIGYKYRLAAYSSAGLTGYIDSTDFLTEPITIDSPANYYRITYSTTSDTQPDPTTNPSVLHMNQFNFFTPSETELIIDKNGTHNTLVEGLQYAKDHNIKVIYVKSGEWDIVDELGADFFTGYDSSSPRGLFLGNGMHIIFDSNAKVVCNYTGSNNYVKSLFSPFNVGAGGFTIENLNLVASNVRYCIHDDRSGGLPFYHNKYVNCKMQLDNRNNAAWDSPQCIGGGFGANGYIEIIGCYFKSLLLKSPNSQLVTYHNSSAADAISKLVIKDSYFDDNGTIRVSWYGSSTLISEAYISNNSLGAVIVESGEGGSTNINTEVIAWNNEIRS